jgi:lipoprotein signal peptidase
MNDDKSIHLTKFLDFPKNFKNENLNQKWLELIKIRNVCNISIEEKRASKEIGSSLEASLKINLDKKLNEISKDVDFSELCITSSAEVSYLENSETKVQTSKAEGSKCQVCWKITKEACSRKTLSKTHRMIFESIKKIFNISLLVPVFIFTLDRISKIYVINLSKNSSDIELFSSKFLNITLIWNEGIAFGIFSAIHGYWYNLLTIAIVLIAIVILIMSIRQDGTQKYFLLIVFGGALGNLYDRIFFKAVPDFIDLHVGDFHWFIFNIADIFITFGVIMLILWETLPLNKNYEKK